MKQFPGNYKSIFQLLMLFLVVAELNGQEVENKYQTRTEFKFAYNPLDKVQISVTPEMRFDEQFSIDKFLIETGVKYKPFKLISFAGYYRYVSNSQKEGGAEILHRYAFDATFKKDFKRFKSSVRLKYTNYTEEKSASDFLRLKAQLEYNIRNCKLSPFAGIEGYRNLSEATYYKMRYTAGIEYKLNKRNAVNVSYKLDYYLQELTNKHIVNIGYRFKF